MLGRGVDPQTLLFDSQPTEVASTRPRGLPTECEVVRAGVRGQHFV